MTRKPELSSSRPSLWPMMVDPLLLLVWGFAVALLLWGSGLDVAMQVWLNANYDQEFNTAMRWLGVLGKGGTQAMVCLLIGAAWFVRGRRKQGGCNVVGIRCVLMAVPVFLLASVINWILKWSIGRERPKEFLWNGVEPNRVNPFEFSAQWWSFPSGHSCSTFAIGMWLALAFPRHRALFLTVAMVLSFSRFLALTPHYMGDVVAGAALGAAVALAVWRLCELKRKTCDG